MTLYKNPRRSKIYKNMSRYWAVATAEGFSGENPNPKEFQCAWQYIIDTKLNLQLQGWFGRNAEALIHQGICLPPK